MRRRLSRLCSEERLRRFFVRVNACYQISRSVRDVCIFARQNMTKDPPFSKIDIVLCRNVLLYLSTEKKALAFERLASSMAADGYFMLGAGETVIGQTEKLVADPKARGLYRPDHREKADRRTGDDRRRIGRG